MFLHLPESLIPDPNDPQKVLDAAHFVDLEDLTRFVAVICAEWGYVCGMRERKSRLGQCTLTPEACHPHARLSHARSHSLVRFCVLLDGVSTRAHEFAIEELSRDFIGHVEACRWYEKLCAGIDSLIVYGLVGQSRKLAEVDDAIKVCQRCEENGHVYPRRTNLFDDRWLCAACKEICEKELLEEQKRQEHLAALTEKYAGAEEAAHQLAMEEELKKLTPSLRFKILERDQFTCQLCGRTPPEIELTVDHKIPILEGGESEEDNLWALCRDCNADKRARIIELPEWAEVG